MLLLPTGDVAHAAAWAQCSAHARGALRSSHLVVQRLLAGLAYALLTGDQAAEVLRSLGGLRKVQGRQGWQQEVKLGAAQLVCIGIVCVC
jgi:hypothetical protein